MRLNRLDLTRFGKFTDDTIDFGKRRPDGPDFHVIYGPNEAGKSTMLAAFLDLLFKIEPRSQYNFLHPYPTMRIGASLDIGSATRELVRIKRPSNDLLDENDQPISDGLILSELGGVDRDSYMTMFSLDDETLEAGGESILASKGDLGQLLFSASAGLSNLSHTLVNLRSEADRFYKYRARSGELADLKANLAELRSEKETIDTLASEYATLIQERDRTADQYEQAISDRSEIQGRRDEINRYLAAMPRLAALRRIRENLSSYADIPDPPLGWDKQVPQLRLDEVELSTKVRGIENEIKQLSDDLNSIVVNEAALLLSVQIDDLTELRARHMTADRDLPQRRLQLESAERAVSGILIRIGREGEADPASLLLADQTVDNLRELMEARSGIVATLEAAREEKAKALRRLDEAEGKLSEKSNGLAIRRGLTIELSRLATAIGKARESDHVVRRRQALRSRGEHMDTLSEHLSKLRPWNGNVEELQAMSVPGSFEIECWNTAIDEAETALNTNNNDLDRLIEEQTRLEAKAVAIAESTGVVGERQIAEIRSARERAWADHRQKLDKGTADAFEATLRDDDNATNARINRARDVARLKQIHEDLAICKADLDQVAKKKDEITSNLQGIRNDIGSAVQKMSPALSCDISLSQLKTWLTFRENALEHQRSITGCNRIIAEAEADGNAVRQQLIDALNSVGAPSDGEIPLDALLNYAQKIIDQDAELRSLNTDFEARKGDVADRDEELAKATRADEAWTAVWLEICRGCWLGEADENPSVSVVREILPQLSHLNTALSEMSGLADRINKMTHDQKVFLNALEQAGTGLELDVKTMPPLALVEEILSKMRDAVEAKSEKAKSTERLEKKQEAAKELTRMLEAHETLTSEMITYFNVETLQQVGECIQGSQRRTELQDQADEAVREILEVLNMTSIEEAELILDALDCSALETELSGVQARFDDQDQRVRELFSQHSNATDRVQAVGGDDAVARIDEKRRTILLEIEDGAQRYLRLRAGILAAEQALHVYRDQHRSSMMARASEAFRTISRGDYTGLTTQPEKDSEVLIALDAEGRSKIASELSKGTRFQLYLALRVAGYHEFVSTRQPLPFIADDIMETFDDFRAGEAFRLLAEMAQVGQVIYLTHHQHLCEIARQAAPTVTVHNMQ